MDINHVIINIPVTDNETITSATNRTKTWINIMMKNACSLTVVVSTGGTDNSSQWWWLPWPPQCGLRIMTRGQGQNA